MISVISILFVVCYLSDALAASEFLIIIVEIIKQKEAFTFVNTS